MNSDLSHRRADMVLDQYAASRVQSPEETRQTSFVRQKLLEDSDIFAVGKCSSMTGERVQDKVVRYRVQRSGKGWGFLSEGNSDSGHGLLRFVTAVTMRS